MLDHSTSALNQIFKITIMSMFKRKYANISLPLKYLYCEYLIDYYPFKKYVEYIFSLGCLSMMSRSVLRL